MNIKFSHKYKKLQIVDDEYCEKIKLLDVIDVRLEDLSKEFLEYDTDNGLFQLPESGDYLMLIFLKNDFHIMTTLRKRNDKTIAKYRSHIGEWFDVEFVEEDSK